MLDLEKCTGCSACALVCPRKCITMSPDEKGFLRPVIDGASCINCRACERVCPVLSPLPFRSFGEVYGVKQKDTEKRKTSQSGGAFAAIAEYVISEGGVVYGVAYSEDFSAAHVRIATGDGIAALKGSKYFQSDVRDTFSELKADLEKGVLCLYSGTPCQIAGVKAFLKKPYVNLITLDLICHGVPSAKLWKEYLAYYDKKYKGKIDKAICRDPESWNDFQTGIFVNGKKHKNREYIRIYSSFKANRESCYGCRFNTEKYSDITIGDFWGIEKVNESFKDIYGVSLMILNTEKGKEIFEKVRESFDYFPTTFEDAARGNPLLCGKKLEKSPADDFWGDYLAYGYRYIRKRYGGAGVKNALKRKIKKVLVRLGLR